MKKYILLTSFVLTSISLSLSPAFKEKSIFNETTEVTSPYKDNTNEKYDLSIKKENENTIVNLILVYKPKLVMMNQRFLLDLLLLSRL